MILVTGGTGLVGSHLLLKLVQGNEPVRALVRDLKNLNVIKSVFKAGCKNPDELFLKIDFVEGNVLDVFSIHEALTDVSKVYHCAAIVSFHEREAEEMFKVNIEGTANIVNACLEKKIQKLCYVSSTAAIGKTLNKEVLNETEEWNPDGDTSNYSKSKHLSELEVWRGAQEGLNVVIVNPSVILGYSNWDRSSSALFKTIFNGLPFYTTGENAFVYVDDVVDSMVQLMESNISSERFLLIGENLPFKAIFESIAIGFKKSPPKLKATYVLLLFGKFIYALKELFTGKKATITNETVKSCSAIQKFSNEKIRKAIGIEFTKINSCIPNICNQYLAE